MRLEWCSAVRLSLSFAALVALAGCGSAPPARERVPRSCAPLAWVGDEGEHLAVRFRVLGDDAWLVVRLEEETSTFFGLDRLASVGVRRQDDHVLVSPLFGASPTEGAVLDEPERVFAEGALVGTLGRDGLEGRVVEIDTRAMQMCDRYDDEVAGVTLTANDEALAGPFTGRPVVVRVRRGDATVGRR